MSNITQILTAPERGETCAAEELLPLVYEELRRLRACPRATGFPGELHLPLSGSRESTNLRSKTGLTLTSKGRQSHSNERSQEPFSRENRCRRITPPTMIMKTPSLQSLSLTTLLLGALLGAPMMTAQAQGRPISLPPQAAEVAHGIYDLGLAHTAEGTVVQGFAFVHYKKEFAKPEKPGSPKPPKASSCYAFLSSGVKWKVTEPYVFDETASYIDALPSAGDLLAEFETAVATWEIAAGKDILGPGSPGIVYPDEVGALNNRNEVMFGEIAESGVIAVTYVWGVWSGPPAGRQLVEWDMVFGTGWAWGDEVTNPGNTLTDFLNIATHELGHAVGLDHPSDACTEETMYAYADYNETKKRDLNAGDIAGIQKLYP